jgi:hypothetical protein
VGICKVRKFLLNLGKTFAETQPFNAQGSRVIMVIYFQAQQSSDK